MKCILPDPCQPTPDGRIFDYLLLTISVLHNREVLVFESNEKLTDIAQYYYTRIFHNHVKYNVVCLADL